MKQEEKVRSQASIRGELLKGLKTAGCLRPAAVQLIFVEKRGKRIGGSPCCKEMIHFSGGSSGAYDPESTFFWMDLMGFTSLGMGETLPATGANPPPTRRSASSCLAWTTQVARGTCVGGIEKLLPMGNYASKSHFLNWTSNLFGVGPCWWQEKGSDALFAHALKWEIGRPRNSGRPYPRWARY